MASSTTESYLQLLGLAVHEFRTPASVVGGYLRMLQRDAAGELNDRQRKMIDEAEKSCARLVTLIAEMSDVAKLDSGVIALARQPVDIFALVSEVAEHVQEARDREVRLEVRGEDGAAHLSGDATRLRAAFDAVFRAVLREKGGPCVVVVERRRETQNGKGAAVVVVSDAATVQAAYERDRGVFDEKRGGMGLALPLARRVIEGHGGRIAAPAPVPGGDAAPTHDPLAADPVSRWSAIITLPLTE
jgi:signal transduction histidine kinase